MQGGEAPPRMVHDPALKRRAAGPEGALRAHMHFRASAFVPPTGMGAGDTARCRICLQSDLCSELVKPCGCMHLEKRSAYTHLSCILRWVYLGLVGIPNSVREAARLASRSGSSARREY